MHKHTIVCMKWGDKFGAEYVNRLYGMIARNTSLPFKLICFTDNAKGITNEVECRPLPPMDLPPNIPERGWRKLSLFQKGIFDQGKEILFFDLDVVIVDTIDALLTYNQPFAITYDKKRSKRKLEGNSSVFRFKVDAFSDLYDNFVQNFESIRASHRHEQAYLSAWMHEKGLLRFWPREWVASFKYDCAPPLWLSPFKAPTKLRRKGCIILPKPICFSVIHSLTIV